MKVLICGYGNMGKIHSKYLNKLGIDWEFYDPKTKSTVESLAEVKKHNFTHIIISSSEEYHFENYEQLRSAGFSGPILVEKPAVIKRENFSIFEDPKLSVGLVERFNPAVQVLKRNLEIDNLISCDFIRCSVKNTANNRVDAFTDVGIHDVDLYFYLFGNGKFYYDFENFSDTFSLVLREGNKFISRFLWSNETNCKERKITIRHTNFTLEADLINQIVTKISTNKEGKMVSENLYVEKGSPIQSQMETFLKNGITYKGVESHNLYFELKEENNV
jgi:predicted dehydrogenase